MSTDRHAGRVVLVTGGGSGIGRATALRLAAEGAAVGVLDRDLDAAAAVADEITAAGHRACAVFADVRDEAQVDAAVGTVIDELGPVTGLVNSAGVVTMTPFDELSLQEWDLVVDVNLKGPFVVTRAVAGSMAGAGGGAVVNLSTVESEVVVSSTGHPQVHYNASKGGVKMLTKALAVELADRSIRVNAVAPGPVATDFVSLDALRSPEAWAFMSTRLLVPRVGEPDDVAAAVSFLLSDDASWITGVQLPVDGGWLTR